MYLLEFAQFLTLGRMRVQQEPFLSLKWSFKDVEDILFWGVVGVILGGRLGYVLFYMPDFYLSNPLNIFKVWEGGMSFHGGLLGVLVALLWFAKSRKLSYFVVTDFVAPLVPLGLAFGRLGNFINGELWGRPTQFYLGMIFPNVDDIPRHPSQLYESFFEGFVMFILLWLYSSQRRKTGQIAALFLILYGTFRFLIEFTREPDSFLGLLFLNLSMGQWLSIPMLLAGIYLFKKN
jgi:phosphatidylglycerol:prolipoprotein diacylglycerol transferase